MPNPTPTATPADIPVHIPRSVPVYLAGIQSDLSRVQELVPPGSLLWLYAHIARRAVRRSLDALDQPPAARLYVCAKPRPRFLGHLEAATDRALSIAARVIDDLFTGMARESAHRAARALLDRESEPTAATRPNLTAAHP
jgi:hypothetical protein